MKDLIDQIGALTADGGDEAAMAALAKMMRGERTSGGNKKRVSDEKRKARRKMQKASRKANRGGGKGQKRG